MQYYNLPPAKYWNEKWYVGMSTVKKTGLSWSYSGEIIEEF